MIHTPLTRLLDLSAPVQLAGMPGVATPELVTAVAAAGGLGMFPATSLPAEVLDAALDDLGARISGAFGVNFLMPFLDRECVTIAARKSRLVEFFYGEPDPDLVEHVHSAGALACWQVGSLAEAAAAERAGCDVVVAQGTEAGGHVRGRTSLVPLLAEVLESLTVPVVAAGGIATGRDLAAVLACGASGARVGTRFVAAAESGAHPAYVKALVAAGAADTALTEAFSVMWPNAPHRVLRSCIATAGALTDDIVGAFRQGGRTHAVRRFSTMPPTRETTGNIAAMALYAGESVTSVQAIEPAASIVADLVTGAADALERAAGCLQPTANDGT